MTDPSLDLQTDTDHRTLRLYLMNQNKGPKKNPYFSTAEQLSGGEKGVLVQFILLLNTKFQGPVHRRRKFRYGDCRIREIHQRDDATDRHIKAPDEGKREKREGGETPFKTKYKENIWSSE